MGCAHSAQRLRKLLRIVCVNMLCLLLRPEKSLKTRLGLFRRFSVTRVALQPVRSSILNNKRDLVFRSVFVFIIQDGVVGCKSVSELNRGRKIIRFAHNLDAASGSLRLASVANRTASFLGEMREHVVLALDGLHV